MNSLLAFSRSNCSLTTSGQSLAAHVLKNQLDSSLVLLRFPLFLKGSSAKLEGAGSAVSLLGLDISFLPSSGLMQYCF